MKLIFFFWSNYEANLETLILFRAVINAIIVHILLFAKGQSFIHSFFLLLFSRQRISNVGIKSTWTSIIFVIDLIKRFIINSIGTLACQNT